MASPSSFEGLNKSQIKKRLDEMKKQHEVMQRKLEKSEKAARAKSHVKKKIADYKLKQSTAGSPECTVFTVQQELSSSVNTGNKEDPTSILKEEIFGIDKTSSKKKSKMRSVSFHLTDQRLTGKRDHPAKSSTRENELNRMTQSKNLDFNSPAIKERSVVGNMGISPGLSTLRTRILFDDTDSDIHECQEKEPQSVTLSSLSDNQFPVRTTPIEVCDERLRKRTSQYPNVTTSGSLPQKPPESDKPSPISRSKNLKLPQKVSVMHESIHKVISQNELSGCVNVIKSPPEDTQLDLFADPDVTPESYSTRNSAKQVTNQTHAELCKEKDGTIDSITTYQTASIKLDQHHNQTCVHNHQSSTKVSQRSSSSQECDKKVSLIDTSSGLLELSVKEVNSISLTQENNQLSISSQTDMGTSVHGLKYQTNDLLQDRSEDLCKKSSDGLKGNLEILQQHPVDKSRKTALECGHNIIENMEANVCGDPRNKPAVSDGRHIEIIPDKRKCEERKKRQKDVENLSIDDVSLKNFVLSQQNCQEGNHTWIDGLMYPAEYYVRNTRSMSKYSSTQHSAPVVDHELPRRHSVSKTVYDESYPLSNLDTCGLVDIGCSPRTEPIAPVHKENSGAPSKARKEKPIAKIRVSRKPVAQRRVRKPITKRTKDNLTHTIKKDESSSNKVMEIQEFQSCCDTTESIPACNAPIYPSELTAGNSRESELSIMIGGADALSSQHVQRDVECASEKGLEVQQPLIHSSLKYNLLESQHTQTQIPSAFALPTLYASPGNLSLTQENLLSSITSLCENPLENAIGTGMIYREEDMSHLQEGTVDPWDSQAYLADVVPETTHPEISEQSSSQLVENDLLKLDNCSHGTYKLEQAAVPSQIDSNFGGGSPFANAGTDINSNAASISLLHLKPIYKRVKSNGASGHAEFSEDMQGSIPSSMHSIVDQGLPFTGSDTGTQTETAEVLLVQSQSMHSMSSSAQLEREEMQQREEDLRQTSSFKFRGCLEHDTESSKIVSITSSSILIDCATKHVLVVHFPTEIFVWIKMDNVEEGGEFKVLSSWSLEKEDEVVQHVHPFRHVNSHFQAVTIIRHDRGAQSMRLLRFDVYERSWKEKILFGADFGSQTISTLCVNQNRWIAMALHNLAGDSTVICSQLDDKWENHPRDIEVLLSTPSTINTLTVVAGGADMILGMTCNKAYLWYLPSCQLVKEFSMSIHDVTHCIKATAESGAIFVITFKKDINSNVECRENQSPTCHLLVLNAVSGRSSPVLNYTRPSNSKADRILDVSVSEESLAACLASGLICLWDICSSQLIASSETSTDHISSLVSLYSNNSILLADGQCVNIYER